ncbi:MAG: hypothetical protein ACYTEQ_05840 [Planctomycetota bacterium]|jgi:hypothetical protein
MRINVPPSAREHFWEEPPVGHAEFWAFRFKPKCEPGDKLEFYFDGKKVAEARVCNIEPPGQSQCAGTGRFRNRWKVYWLPETFVDLREREFSHGQR